MNLSDFVTFPPTFACYVLMQVEMQQNKIMLPNRYM